VPRRVPDDLTRFVLAQEADYETALSEIRSGRKRSHWMWYIFPQYEGLGQSAMSLRYAIRSRAEADAFGNPDDMKLRSCATLFAYVSPPGSVFERLLDRYFRGERDAETLRLLGVAGGGA
jgi:uncharacterized protein (DUF1810 family)